LDFFFGRRDPNDFLSRLVTMDETWLYHYDPETKQQPIEWLHRGSPRPKKTECKNPLEKFWDQDGVLIDYLPKDQIINAEYYLSAPAHQALTTQQKLAYQGFQCLHHPPYSPDWPRRITTCSLD
jgi:hypothetical protein